MSNFKKTRISYIKLSLLTTLALSSIPTMAKAEDFRLQFGIAPDRFAVGYQPSEWREHEWREHQLREWREHEWREHQLREERSRARYYQNSYYWH